MYDDGLVQNYNETLVFNEIKTTLIDTDKVESEDIISDIACLALNMLTPRYIRFPVDTAFYTSQEEQRAAHQKVSDAVIAAYGQVMNRPTALYKSD